MNERQESCPVDIVPYYGHFTSYCVAFFGPVVMLVGSKVQTEMLTKIE